MDRRLVRYAEKAPEEIPAYRLGEIAHYLAVPKSTLRSWIYGQAYRDRSGKPQRFKPLIRLEDDDRGLLSFFNLIEAHVLTALRRQHFVPMPAIRRALEHILREFPKSRHPLAEHQFATFGKSLFIEHVNSLVNVSKDGQTAMLECLDKYLQRIERTPQGNAASLYPFPRLYQSGRRDWIPPKSVLISPRVAFGRPVLAGTNIPTAVIAERFSTGETPEEVARDYDRSPADILEAIRWEIIPAAA
jgi:uncharacterized protein (DUF433 family)